MSHDDIIRMAREAGAHEDFAFEGKYFDMSVAALERFAELVRKDYSTTHANLWLDRIHKFMLAEREACAKVCDDFERAKWESVKNIAENGGRLAFSGPMHCAAAIRARGQA